jgi:hypothetical protein
VKGYTTDRPGAHKTKTLASEGGRYDRLRYVRLVLKRRENRLSRPSGQARAPQCCAPTMESERS